jgi:oligopeptide transport system substrate-binding protein
MTTTRILLLLLVLALSGQLSAAPSVIHRGLIIEPPSLDPSLGTSGPAGPVLSDLVEGLVVRGTRGEPVPGSAKSWSVSDDGLTYLFLLREGLQWSDGRPLTAEDFVYSFRRLIDPATGARAAGLFFIIEGAAAVARRQAEPENLGVSAPDPLTVEIRLERPAPYFIQLLANSQGVPVPRHVVQVHGRAWTRPANMVSNGAYELAERVPQTHVKLVRNPRFYAADSVTIDEVYWYPVQDLGTSFRQFRAGELDTLLMAPPDEMGWIKENMADALHVNPIQATYYLAFNVDRPPLDDHRVRRALVLAVDQAAIADKVLQRTARPAVSLVTPGIGGYPGFTPADADRPLTDRQTEARRLLAEAGFGGDSPLRLTGVYDTQEENRKVMLAIATMWRTIGVQADFSNIEGRALMGKLRSRDFQIARSSLFAVYDDAYAMLEKFRGDSTDNRPGFSNPRYDELLDQANATADPEQRLKLLMAGEELLLAEHPLVPIYWYIGRVLVNPEIRGWIDAPLGTPPTRYLSFD